MLCCAGRDETRHETTSRVRVGLSRVRIDFLVDRGTEPNGKAQGLDWNREPGCRAAGALTAYWGRWRWGRWRQAGGLKIRMWRSLRSIAGKGRLVEAACLHLLAQAPAPPLLPDASWPTQPWNLMQSLPERRLH